METSLHRIKKEIKLSRKETLPAGTYISSPYTPITCQSKAFTSNFKETIKSLVQKLPGGKEKPPPESRLLFFFLIFLLHQTIANVRPSVCTYVYVHTS